MTAHEPSERTIGEACELGDFRRAATLTLQLCGPEIQRRQQERDAERLATKRLTLRDEDLMRKNMGGAGLPVRRKRVA